MHHTIKQTYVFRCHFCPIVVEVALERNPEASDDPKPEGWDQVLKEEHDCGLTGYTRRTFLNRCPKCKKKKAGEK